MLVRDKIRYNNLQKYPCKRSEVETVKSNGRLVSGFGNDSKYSLSLFTNLPEIMDGAPLLEIVDYSKGVVYVVNSSHAKVEKLSKLQ